MTAACEYGNCLDVPDVLFFFPGSPKNYLAARRRNWISCFGAKKGRQVQTDVVVAERERRNVLKENEIQ
jgi:hypothetical protein